jgi:flagellar basal body-associated protein FliL
LKIASQGEEKKEPKKKNYKKWLILIVALIALSAGGYTYYSLILKNAPAQISKKEIQSLTLPSVTVNLVNGNKSRYLKTTIVLEFASKEVEEELKVSSYRVKDSVLRVLRGTSASSLDNPLETEILKEQLLKEINATLTTGEVIGLYFLEFLVQ